MSKTANPQKAEGVLIENTEIGVVVRQEIVSMIPPLLANIKDNYRILDLCAAPGSKTSEILDLMQAQNTINSLPRGCLVANDVNEKRCGTLNHQMARFAHPGFAVTCCDGSMLPEKLKYDLVFADVPCSGDGTIRKAFDIWKRWSYNDGVQLHRLQIKLLKKSLLLLKQSGHLVYSTCSLNPLENEAVVASILYEYPEKFELVPVKPPLGLIKNDGLTSWSVPIRRKDNSNYLDKSSKTEIASTDSAQSSIEQPQMSPAIKLLESLIN
uniref:tRNA (Cytosine(34)-C(5))-methyltransferase-like n=1 Tax=Dermatophagoides pteronyssinus TaxID=6956 RepID=A0A6P6YC76_DERPT|nr:tRNA (cytosine(34)-C(5))-methyltransferase-like [Dermatophagoides pteronyssinus]